MANLIVRHSPGWFFRNRKYLIYVDGVEIGVLSYRSRQLSLDLDEGVYVITIADRFFSVIETVLITDKNTRIDIYAAVSQKIINGLLALVTIAVLVTFFLFLKGRQTSIQLLLLTLLIPLCLVIFTSRKGATESFSVSVT